MSSSSSPLAPDDNPLQLPEDLDSYRGQAIALPFGSPEVLAQGTHEEVQRVIDEQPNPEQYYTYGVPDFSNPTPDVAERLKQAAE